MLRRTAALVVIATATLPTMSLALGSTKAMYVGGTITARVPEKSEGQLDTSNEQKLVFTADKGKGVAELQYKMIDSFEYGQKASHRIKTAIFLTPWSLFAKKRNHYLSLLWKDETGADQGVVLELGKDLLRPTVMVLQARTGKKVVFQD